MSRAGQEAALWVARRMDAAGAQDAEFEAWKSADPAHAAAYQALWNTTQDPALAEALSRSAQAQARTMPRRRPAGVLIGGLALAASILLAVLVWPDLQVMTVRPTALETAVGQQRAVVLADGSRVMLDGATRLEVQIGTHRRRVRLERGEAFFEVAHDAARPFVVSAPEGSARVLGTAFDLDRSGGRLELSVHRGRVRLAPTGLIHRTAELTVGQRAFAIDGQLSAIRPFDPAADDWRTGWLETEGVTLERLVERLNRGAAKPIVIADKSLAKRRVAGRFRLDEPDALVRNLALMHGFTARDEDGRLVLTR
jgi:transmembrane sensor